MLSVFVYQEMPSGPVFGLFCAIAAVAMAFQTLNAYRGGFMYRGRSEKVFRNEEPMKFKLWLTVQASFVLFFVAMSVYGFLS